MREIKFRGKRISNGKWLYGDLMHDTVGGCYVFPIDCAALYKENAILPETIGQYTGIKDVNGTEVYEGDILHVAEHENELINTFGSKAEFDAFTLAECAGKKKKDYVTSIRFCDGGFVFKDEKGCDTDLCVLAGDQRASSPVYIFDVIGNVYEHPERANASYKC